MPRTGLSESFEEVLSDIVRWLAEESIELAGLVSALDDAGDAGIDPEYAATFLVGLEATKTWYVINRPAYDLARNLTDGNSRYAGRHAELIEERNELNRSSFYRQQNLILLGYVSACGMTTISKKLFDPVAECVRGILDLPDYALDGEDTRERVYKILHKRGMDLRKADPSADLEGLNLFKKIHAIRTGLSG